MEAENLATLPKNMLNELSVVLSKLPQEDVLRLKTELLKNPYILGAKYYEIYNRDPRYCIFGLLSGICEDEWQCTTFDEKVRHAWKYAIKAGSLIEDETSTRLLSIETFIMDREALRKKPLLTKEEILDIIGECNKHLKGIAA